MIIKIALLGLVLCVSFGFAQPSAAEFNLFCRILAEANNLMYGPDYVYDENEDRETIKEMTMLYNATTDDVNEFRKTLWDTKDFFEAHPPPTQSENRKKAHREIGNLIKEGEDKIEENKKIAEKVNEEIGKAKLSVAQGLYGEHVSVVPKDEKNITEILKDTNSIFQDNKSASASCGNQNTPAGKTLINDLFCVCAGEGWEAERPCHPKIWPPKSWSSDCCKGGSCRDGCCKNNNYNCCDCKWTLIKFGIDKPPLIPFFNESFQKIERVCREEMIQGDIKPKNMPALLDEYADMIGSGGAKMDKKIFGHSERRKERKVTECTGTGSSDNFDGPEKNNKNICVDYANHTQDGKTYNIPWHNKFREASEKLQDAKKIEERILKNRADLLLLKSQAWVAYSREKDDETSNLDDMNVSHLFDATQLPLSFPFPFLFPFLFLIS